MEAEVGEFVVVIKTGQFDASAAFYRDVLRFALVEEWTEHGHGAVFSAAGSARVELIDMTGEELPATSDRTFVGLKVATIDEYHQRAVAAACDIGSELAARPWGGRGFVVRDPNGVAFNIYTAYVPADPPPSA